MSPGPKLSLVTPAWICFAVFFLLGVSLSGAQPSSGSTVFKKIDPKKNILDTIAWAQPRKLPGKGTLQEFKTLFNTLHGKSSTAVFSKKGSMAELAYDRATGAFYSRDTKAPGLKQGKEVMGWHPYWMKDAYLYYPYELLSTIAFFAYDVNPQTGSYNDADAIAQWLATPMIDSVKKHNGKALLTLTSYGEVSTSKLLGNEKAWVPLGDSVKMLLRKRNADGIDLDFTGILPTMGDSFTDFVSFLKNKLGDSVTIMVEVPYYAITDAYDFARLKQHATTFIIRGFDHDGMLCQNKPVPPAPLAGTLYCWSLQNAVERCIGGGVSPDSIVVSMPLYGTQWRYKKPNWSFVANVPYEDIRGRYATNTQQFVEEPSGSAMIRLGEAENHDVIWYEGQASMSRKFKWMQDNQLHGAGLWGLGYDGNNPEIWTAVRENFGAGVWHDIRPDRYGNGKAYGLMASLQKYRKIAGIAVFIILCFFLAGLLLSCLDWRVRDAFFHNNSYRALLAGTLMVTLALVVYLLSGHAEGPGQSHSEDQSAPFFYGVLAGSGLVYLANSLYLYYRKRLH